MLRIVEDTPGMVICSAAANSVGVKKNATRMQIEGWKGIDR